MKFTEPQFVGKGTTDWEAVLKRQGKLIIRRVLIYICRADEAKAAGMEV
jgi:hypothetical protein